MSLHLRVVIMYVIVIQNVAPIPHHNFNSQHLPFEWPTNKAVWGAKLTLFVGTGFGIPFFATWFQL